MTGAIEVAEKRSAALANWLAAPGAVPVALPAHHSRGAGAVFASVVDDAVAPVRSDTEQRRAEVRAAARGAEAERRQVTVEREAVASKQDPRPIGAGAGIVATGPSSRPRAVRRSGSSSTSATTWRSRVRSAVEAALGASGLLDAWVSPDGRVVGDVEDAFALADLSTPADGRLPRDPAHHLGGEQPDHLGTVLRPDPHGSRLGAGDVVGTVLTRVGLADTVPARRKESARVAEPGLFIGRDWTWQAGALVGRTSKPAAQFIGATARAAERARRLALLGARLTELEDVIATARAEVEAHTSALGDLDRWHRSRPSHETLLGAWATELAAASAVEEAAAEVAATRRVAEAARAASAKAREELVSLGQVHDLPITSTGLLSSGSDAPGAADPGSRPRARPRGARPGLGAVAGARRARPCRSRPAGGGGG